MPRHDLRCLKCERAEEILLSLDELKALPSCPCGGSREIFYPAVDFSISFASWCLKDAVVVYENPKTGQISYPGRNDRPIPKRLADAGFERKEMRSLRQVEKFEKEHKVLNQAMHYDSGSGRGSEEST